MAGFAPHQPGRQAAADSARARLDWPALASVRSASTLTQRTNAIPNLAEQTQHDSTASNAANLLDAAGMCSWLARSDRTCEP